MINPSDEFEVVCDETNNSEQDRKDRKLNVDIYIRPYQIFYETRDEGE